MIILRILLLLAGMAVAGCANPGQLYVSQHPEMKPAHRQILTTGKIPSGDAVAGLTRDEIRLAMGGPPAVFDKFNGQETWSYLKKNTAPLDPVPSGSGSSGSRSRPADLRTELGDADLNVNVRTTIFFQADRATRAEVTQEKP
jgi:outer membrane protein assembly factor BamE (lipoprotein component of BamABCDE complex)